MRAILQQKTQSHHLSAWKLHGIATRQRKRALACFHLRIWREQTALSVKREIPALLDQDCMLELQVWTRRWNLARKIKSLSGWQGVALSQRDKHAEAHRQKCSALRKPSQTFFSNSRDCAKSAYSSLERDSDDELSSVHSLSQEETVSETLVSPGANEEKMDSEEGETSGEEQKAQKKQGDEQNADYVEAEEVMNGHQLPQHGREGGESFSDEERSWRPSVLACLPEEYDDDEDEEHTSSWSRVNSMLERLEAEAKSAVAKGNGGGNASTVDDGSPNLLNVRTIWEKRTRNLFQSC